MQTTGTAWVPIAFLLWICAFTIPFFVFKPGTFLGNFYRLNLVWVYLGIMSTETAKIAGELFLGILLAVFFLCQLAVIATRKGVPLIELAFTYYSFYSLLPPITGSEVFSALITAVLVWVLYELLTKRLAPIRPFVNYKRYEPPEEEW